MGLLLRRKEGLWPHLGVFYVRTIFTLPLRRTKKNAAAPRNGASPLAPIMGPSRLKSADIYTQQLPANGLPPLEGRVSQV